MINKVLNYYRPSFKRVYLQQGFDENMSPESKEKMRYVLYNVDSLFPANDVLFYSKEKDNVSCRVKDVHPLKFLAHPSILSSFKDPENVVNMASVALALDSAYKNLHHIKDEVYEIEIGDITNLDQGEIMFQLLEKITVFNVLQKRKKNYS